MNRLRQSYLRAPTLLSVWGRSPQHLSAKHTTVALIAVRLYSYTEFKCVVALSFHNSKLHLNSSGLYGKPTRPSKRVTGASEGWGCSSRYVRSPHRDPCFQFNPIPIATSPRRPQPRAAPPPAHSRQSYHLASHFSIAARRSAVDGVLARGGTVPRPARSSRADSDSRNAM